MTPERKAELLRIADEWLSPDGERAVKLAYANGQHATAIAFKEAIVMARALKEMLEADEKTVAIEMLTGAQLREKA